MLATALKRSRSTSSSVSSQAITLTTSRVSMAGPKLPPLPEINAKLMLEVFTHRSLVLDESDEADCFQDNQRLAALGERVMQLALAEILYSRKPIVKAADFEAQIEGMLPDRLVESWVDHYHLRKELRAAPGFRVTLTTPRESRTLFNAYAGAVFTTSGMSEITRWIRELLDLGKDYSQIVIDQLEHRPVKKMKNDFSLLQGGSTSMPLSPDPQLPPPPQPPPHPPVPSISTIPHQPFVEPRQSTPSVTVINGSQTSILASFNQYCAQKKYQVDWHANFEGRPHSGRWFCRCIVNNETRGEGQGTSKQLAKEEAARRACQNMGIEL